MVQVPSSPLLLVRATALCGCIAVFLLAGSTDALGAAKGKPKCQGRVATLVGSPGKEIIRGTPGADVIVARGGNDKVFGRGGRDRICGGAGRDTINGGGGLDFADGGGGKADVCKRAEQSRRCERPLIRPRIALMNPPDGGVVNGPIQLHALDLTGSSPARITQVVFSFSPNGVAYNPIGSKPGGEPLSVVWNTTDLPAGSYSVRAQAQLAGGGISSDSAVVTVNSAPIAAATFNCTGPAVNFNAATSSDPDPGDEIVNYAWDFGDGSPIVSGPTAIAPEHVYQATGEFYPELQVTDDRGGIGVVHLGFNLADCQPREKTCDPVSMDVKSSGDSSWAMHWVTTADGKKKHGYNSSLPTTRADWANAADRDTFHINFNFEVDTTLEPNSDPKLCAEGQSVRRTASLGETKMPKKGPKAGASPSASALGEDADCPFDTAVDGPWCDDNYHGGSATTVLSLSDVAEGQVKAHIAQNRIIWIDGPGMNSISKRSLVNAGAGGFTYKAKFKAEVKGVTKTVTCSWQVEIIVKVKDGVPTSSGGGLTDKACA